MVVLLLHDVICSERVTAHCQWGGKLPIFPKIAPSPWDFVTLPEEDRATAIGNMHKYLATEISCGTDRQTDVHADVFITILRHRCRGRSSQLIYRTATVKL